MTNELSQKIHDALQGAPKGTKFDIIGSLNEYGEINYEVVPHDPAEYDSVEGDLVFKDKKTACDYLSENQQGTSKLTFRTVIEVS